MLDSIPDVLIVEVLTYMALPFLKSTKAVNKRLANLGRRVLRSGRWHKIGFNLAEMSDELQSTTVSMKFPIKVALLEPLLFGHRQLMWCLQDDAVIATIYSINVVYWTEQGTVLKKSTALPIDRDYVDDDERVGFRGEIVDLCIEIPGHGLIASEDGLRMAMHQILVDRGVEVKQGLRMNITAKDCRIMSTSERDRKNPSCLHRVRFDPWVNCDDVRTNELLDLMTLVTDVGDNTCLIHGVHSCREDFAHMTMRVALMFHDSRES
jgi:hypothetical protein